jgi:hypothetical protein
MTDDSVGHTNQCADTSIISTSTKTSSVTVVLLDTSANRGDTCMRMTPTLAPGQSVA